MQNVYLIGVDLGTTGNKAAIFDETGLLVAEAFEETRLYHPEPGVFEQSPNEMYSSTINLIKQCVQKSRVNPRDIAGIAVDGQMAGVCTIDTGWNPVTMYDSWLDTRCGKYLPQLKENENRIIQLTGAPPTFSHGAKILWWKNEFPDIYKKIDSFIQPGAYVAGKLADLKGEDAYIDNSYIHFSCFSDTRNNCWSDELIEYFQISKEKLPKIISPSDIVGYLCKAAALETGLLQGTPIVAGCGDTTASMLGAGMVRPGMIFDLAGTASVFAVSTDEFKVDTKHKTMITARLPISGLNYSLAYINGGGMNLEWFRDEIAVIDKNTFGDLFYPEMDKLAEKIPIGSDKLLFIPHLGGQVCPNIPETRGAFVGLQWSHKKSHMYRAMLEAVAYEYNRYFKIVQDIWPRMDITETHVIGGGSKSKVWNQIKSDVLGVPYINLDRKECGVFGTALLAGYGVGLYENIIDTVESLVCKDEIFQPNKEAVKQYKLMAAEYNNLLNQTQSLFLSLSRL